MPWAAGGLDAVAARRGGPARTVENPRQRGEAMRRELLALCIVIGLFSGCAYVPSTTIDYMDRWKDKLYVVTGDPSIKMLDAKTNRLIKKSSIPGSDWRYVMEGGQVFFLFTAGRSRGRH
jgi:hypothetical protein